MASLADIFAEVKLDLSKAEEGKLRKRIGSIDTKKEGAQVATRFGLGFNGAIGGIISRSAGIFAAGFAGIKIGGFLKDAIAQASDLNETTSKVQQIFGPAAKDIQNFAKSAATSLGQTQQAALDANATFGIFGKSAGLKGKDLSGFTEKLTTLAGDLASFNNTSPEQAIEAIGAALRGETEPIRAYGVLLDDASLRQEALRQGLVKTTKTALTPQQKVLAAQSLIMKQTTAAQGDFARTSGGLANQQRILSASFTDFKTTIGAVALPLAVKFFGFLNQTALPGVRGLYDLVVKGDFSSGFRKAFNVEEDSGLVTFLLRVHDIGAKVFTEITGGIRAFGAAWKANDGDVTSSGFPGFMERLANAARGAFGFFKTDALPVLQRFGGYVIGTAVPAIARLTQNLIASLWPAVRSVFVFFKTDVLPRLQQFGSFLGTSVLPKIGQMASSLSKNKDFLVPFAATIVTIIGAVKAWAVVQGILNVVLSANPIGLVVLAIAGLVAGIVYAYKHSETFRNVVQAAFEGVKKAAQVMGQVIAAVAKGLVAAFQFASPLIKAAINIVIGVFQLWWNVVAKPILNGIVALFKNVFVPALKFVWQQAQAWGRILIAAFNSIKAPAYAAIKYLINNFLSFIDFMLKGAAKAFGWVPGLGPKLKAAAKEFGKFRDNVNAALSGVADQSVNIAIKYSSSGVNLTTPSSVGRKATGGKITGPGGPTDDKAGLYALSDQEWVVRAASAQKYGDHAMKSVNDGTATIIPGFANGGSPGLKTHLIANAAALAGSVRQVVTASAAAVAKQLAKSGGNLAGTMAFGRSQVGKPYVWGAAGPNGYDCSGFVSALINYAKGRPPFHRLGATGSMPWSDMASGSGRFMVGWFKGNPGHTAATINGVNFESRGGRGVVVGSGARGAYDSLFTNRAKVKGFAQGGKVGDAPFDILDPRGKAYGGKSLLQELGIESYATGAWRILADQLAMVHKGEMVVPAGVADGLRGSFDAAGRVRSKLHQLHEQHAAHLAHIAHVTHTNRDARRFGNLSRLGTRPTSLTGDFGSGLQTIKLHPDSVRDVADAVAGIQLSIDGRSLDTALSRSALRRG